MRPMTAKRIQLAFASMPDDGEAVHWSTLRPFLYAKRVPKWLRRRPTGSASWCNLVQIGASWTQLERILVQVGPGQNNSEPNPYRRKNSDDI